MKLSYLQNVENNETAETHDEIPQSIQNMEWDSSIINIISNTHAHKFIL